MPAPAAAAKAAQVAWSARKPLLRLAGIVLAFVLVFAGLPVMFAAGAVFLVAGADHACAAELTSPSTDTAAIQRAARARGTGPVGSALVAAFAASASTQIPTASLEAAGPYRLPPEYAAGTSDSPGRWQGPQDPVTGDITRDSRQVVGAATRAVLRRLQHTDATTWRTLRVTEPVTDPDTITTMAGQASTLFTAAFPYAPLTPEAARTAITTASSVDTGGAADLIAGGVLVIGDPTRTDALAQQLGSRAFGGHVLVQPTTSDSSTVGTGAWKDLAAADGIVLALVSAPPDSSTVQDLADATNAQVIWISATGTSNPTAGVYVADADLTSVLTVLVALPGADAPGPLCDATVNMADAPIDPALIVAPDGGAASAIAYAHAQLGKAYTNPGHPPSTWDCSKLTSWAWATAGVKLAELSYTQWDQTQRIPASAVAPGDLVFWFRQGAHHVALIDDVSGGRIWITEAANPGTGTVRRTLGGGWDDAHLSGYGRVIRPGP